MSDQDTLPVFTYTDLERDPDHRYEIPMTEHQRRTFACVLRDQGSPIDVTSTLMSLATDQAHRDWGWETVQADWPRVFRLRMDDQVLGDYRVEREVRAQFSWTKQ